MRVVHLVAGAGGMYCGSCLHGKTLASALSRAGLDVLLVPVYTPLRTEDDEDARPERVAVGGVNAYLQERFALFRHTPWFLDRLLDHPGLWGWLGRRAAGTRPEQLGAMTVSMLRGREGRQRKEFDKLAAWLARDVRPDLVHLSTALLAGAARPLGERLNVPVVATFSGEDAFLERLPAPHYAEARAELRARCAELGALVALSDYHADFMAEYVSAPRERIHVIPPGLNLEGHPVPPATRRPAASPDREVTIGYLSRISPQKGLHELAEAFILLADAADLPPIRLRAAGYLGADDRLYLDQVHRRLAERGLADRFEYLGELDRAAKLAFLESLDVFCAPAAYPESKALVALEAWASGVPAVLPDHGAFSELVRETGGGLLYTPRDPAALAAALGRMIREPELAERSGRQAHEVIHRRHGAAQMAARTVALYRTLGIL